MGAETKERMAPHDVDCLVLLDLDRTLFDTSTFNLAVRSLARDEFDISLAVMELAQIEAEREGSFDPVGWLEGQLSDVAFQDFITRFEEVHDQEDFLYDDARELIMRLDEADIPVAVMTHGGRSGQKLKLLVSQMQFPFIIIDQANKGERLQTWFDPALQRYVVTADEGQTYRARGFVLIDDKNRNFAGLNADAPHVLCIHVAGRARSGNDAEPDVAVKAVDTLYSTPQLINEHVEKLRAA